MKRTLLLLFFIMMTACSLFVKSPPESGLRRLDGEQLESYTWIDDLEYRGLEHAVDQSIRYYRQLPPYKQFEYKDIIYTPAEMAASLELFIELLHMCSSRELPAQLREKFLFFESGNSRGEAFFTGYYEPVLHGSVVPTEKFSEPLYKTPGDLIKVDLGTFSDKWEDEQIIGRIEGDRLVPYDSREEIMYEKSLEKRASPIVYVNNIELFFLQIQGSGLVKLENGAVMRVNYAQKNGHPYRAVGNILKHEISPEKMSLQAIKEYLYNNPDKVRDILTYNQSYTFFREVEEGPLGDIEVPLTPGRSIAMDKREVPRGGLAFIETEIPVFEHGEVAKWKSLKRFVLVQDTGGAIQGNGRADIFFGHGEEAELAAGHMKQKGRVFLIVARKEFLENGFDDEDDVSVHITECPE